MSSFVIVRRLLIIKLVGSYWTVCLTPDSFDWLRTYFFCFLKVFVSRQLPHHLHHNTTWIEGHMKENHPPKTGQFCMFKTFLFTIERVSMFSVQIATNTHINSSNSRKRLSLPSERSNLKKGGDSHDGKYIMCSLVQQVFSASRNFSEFVGRDQLEYEG